MMTTLLFWLFYEVKAFPTTYFEIARKLTKGIETESSIMNGLIILFSLFMMVGGLIFFLGLIIALLPVVITLAPIIFIAFLIQEKLLPSNEIIIDIIVVPIIAILIYFFGHQYLFGYLIPCFNFAFLFIMGLIGMPNRYSG